MNDGGRLVMGYAARAAARLLSPPGNRNKLLILAFHRVLDAPDPVVPGGMDAATFELQIATLAEHFNVLPLTEAAALMRTARLPARAAAITFDDGYADNAHVALPILLRYGVTATFFIATGFLDGGRMFNDTVIECIRRAPAGALELEELGLGSHRLDDDGDRARVIGEVLAQVKRLAPQAREDRVTALAAHVGASLPDDLMMRSEDVRRLHEAGMEIGGHTVNHPILTSLAPDQAEEEIVAGRRRLAEIIGVPIRSFAFPNGRPVADYDHRHVAILRRLGFEAAVTTAWGCATRESDPLQLPRVMPWDRSELRLVLRLLRTYVGPRAAVA